MPLTMIRAVSRVLALRSVPAKIVTTSPAPIIKMSELQIVAWTGTRSIDLFNSMTID
jgi:hypothetical protein